MVPIRSTRRCAAGLRPTRFQVSNKLAFSNVVAGSYTGSGVVVADIPQGLLDQSPITPTSLVTEICSTAFGYSGDVTPRRAGNTNPPHTRASWLAPARSLIHGLFRFIERTAVRFKPGRVLEFAALQKSGNQK
jgi:hypothetical protein